MGMQSALKCTVSLVDSRVLSRNYGSVITGNYGS